MNELTRRNDLKQRLDMILNLIHNAGFVVIDIEGNIITPENTNVIKDDETCQAKTI